MRHASRHPGVAQQHNVESETTATPRWQRVAAAAATAAPVAHRQRLTVRWRAGVSLRTQELYALVFLTRYLDLFFTFISLCAAAARAVRGASACADGRCAAARAGITRS